MARVSRKQSENVDYMANTSLYNTAIYARLSVKNSNKSNDTEVIENQIQMCKNHILKNEDLKLSKIYVDDGYTGVNFDRPDFQLLLDDIQNGRIDCVVFKDLSRLGRDYLGVGTLIEEFITIYNIRVIFILELFDSLKSSTIELAVPFKSLMNDIYSKELSKKAYDVSRKLREAGGHKRSSAPYGYKLDDTRTKLLIDEEVSGNVKMIFELKYKGYKISEISKQLIEIGCVCPHEYRTKKGEYIPKQNKKRIWSETSISNIYRNPIYTGDTIIGRTECKLYAGSKRKRMPKETWKIVKNTHEQLVDREIFEKINLKRTLNVDTKKYKTNDYKGIIFCEVCGEKMRYDRKVCKYFCKEQIGELNRIEHTVIIEKKRIDSIVYDIINSHFKCTDLSNIESVLKVAKKDYHYYESEIKRIEIKKITAYEDMKKNIISKEVYIKTKNKYDGDIKLLENNILECSSNVKKYSTIKEWLKIINSNKSMLDLECYFIKNLIEMIHINHNKVNIELKYQDVFNLEVMQCK